MASSNDDDLCQKDEEDDVRSSMGLSTIFNTISDSLGLPSLPSEDISQLKDQTKPISTRSSIQQQDKTILENIAQTGDLEIENKKINIEDSLKNDDDNSNTDYQAGEEDEDTDIFEENIAPREAKKSVSLDERVLRSENSLEEQTKNAKKSLSFREENPAPSSKQRVSILFKHTEKRPTTLAKDKKRISFDDESHEQKQKRVSGISPSRQPFYVKKSSSHFQLDDDEEETEDRKKLEEESKHAELMVSPPTPSHPRKSILFAHQPAVDPIVEHNDHGNPLMSPRAASNNTKAQQIRNTLQGCSAQELILYATQAIEAISIQETVHEEDDHHHENHSKMNHSKMNRFFSKHNASEDDSASTSRDVSVEGSEIDEDDIDGLAHLDFAYAHFGHRLQKRLKKETLEDLSHRLEDREHELSYRDDDDDNGDIRNRTFRVGTLATIWSHHLENGLLVFYKVPTVRHRFEDHQHEHEVDWADLFFDLTYVGAAYQLGTLLKSDVSWRCFFHFCAMALCMMDAWKFKTMHDSTFEATDVAHKLTDVFYDSTAAAAAIFIRNLSDMEDLSTGFAFGLSLCLCINAFVLGVEKFEILMRSKDKDAVQQSRNILLIEVAPRVFCYLAASIVSGIGTQWSLSDDDNGSHVGNVRTISLRTVSLCLLSAHFSASVVPLIGYMSKFLPVNPIPWHYEHIAHRYGEWVMLMLGESILSIILTPVHNRFRYYLAFGTALLSVQMMQLVHFSSEEFDAEKHALSRKLRAGRAWVQLMTCYSIALIAYGVGLKAMLYSVVCSSGGDDDHRRLTEDDEEEMTPNGAYSSYSSAYSSAYTSTYSSSTYSAYSSSYSAYGGGSSNQNDYCSHVPRAYTRLLCSASAAQYIFLQLSLTLHEGMAEYMRHFFSFSTRAAYFMIASKVITIAATLALGYFPGNLAAHEILLCITAITFIQSLTQAIENMITHVRKLETWSVRDTTISEMNKKTFYRQKSGNSNFIIRFLFGEKEDENSLRDSDGEIIPPPPAPPPLPSFKTSPSPFFRRKLFRSASNSKLPAQTTELTQARGIPSSF